MLRITFLFIGIFLLSALATGLIRYYALTKNILDVPNQRSSHHIPTPRGGGLAIVLSFTIGCLWLVWLQEISFSLFAAISGGILVAIIGWIDDRGSTSPLYRAGVHGIAALWAVYWINGLSPLSIGFNLLAFITIIWGINFYNFMDGIDGLAGMEGIFVSISAAFILGIMGELGFSVLCLLLGGVIAGFLMWNWPPAKIFMGDVGSGYLGYIFTVLALATANLKILPLLFWIILAAVFVCDATFTVLYRIFQNKRWYEAHCEHAYQRLVQLRQSHKRIVLGILLMNVIVLFPVAVIVVYYPIQGVWLSAGTLTSLFVFWCLIMKRFACHIELI